MINGNAHDLELASQSAMFKASMTDGESGIDGTLTRNSFNELIKNSSLAEYLDKNYESGSFEVRREEDTVLFEYYVAPTFDFIQQLRTFGAELRVLAPLSLAKQMQEEALKVLSRYNDTLDNLK
jgi:predicted DNA-binding transcriptional regulator YafY